MPRAVITAAGTQAGHCHHLRGESATAHVHVRPANPGASDRGMSDAADPSPA